MLFQRAKELAAENRDALIPEKTLVLLGKAADKLLKLSPTGVPKWTPRPLTSTSPQQLSEDFRDSDPFSTPLPFLLPFQCQLMREAIELGDSQIEEDDAVIQVDQLPKRQVLLVLTCNCRLLSPFNLEYEKRLEHFFENGGSDQIRGCGRTTNYQIRELPGITPIPESELCHDLISSDSTEHS